MRGYSPLSYNQRNLILHNPIFVTSLAKNIQYFQKFIPKKK